MVIKFIFGTNEKEHSHNLYTYVAVPYGYYCVAVIF